MAAASYSENHRRTSYLLYACLVIAVALNVAFWLRAHTILPKWDNVPPVPTKTSAAFSMLGDDGAAYRVLGYTLQNLGNTGGNYQPLKIYDYALLEKWFFQTQALDPRANFVPFLAAYYFGAVEDEPERLSHVVNFLAKAGAEPYPQKWRWLAQAVYLARYKEKNMDKALVLANQLAALPGDDISPWARQMPAFVHMQMGDKEAAYNLMVNMLKTDAERLHPNEVNAMLGFICERTLTRAQAARDPLCQTRQ